MIWVCGGGLDILKLTKTQLICSVSCFNLGGMGSFVWGAEAPRGDRTAFAAAILSIISSKNLYDLNVSYLLTYEIFMAGDAP